MGSKSKGHTILMANSFLMSFYANITNLEDMASLQAFQGPKIFKIMKNSQFRPYFSLNTPYTPKKYFSGVISVFFSA